MRPSLIVAIVLAAAIGAVWWSNYHGQNARILRLEEARHAGRHGGFGMNQALPVIAQPAVKGDIHIYLDGLGTVTPLASVTVRTQVSGQLMSVAFREGQTVGKGDLLAIIDPRPYQVALEQAQGQLDQAQAQLRVAESNLSRYVTLLRQDSIAQQQVDTQRALVSQYQGLVESDRAAIDNAKLNLTYCHITAPVGGRVGLRQIDPGNYVTPGDTAGLVVLTQLKPITVIFTLPEDDVAAVSARLRAGATIPVEAYDRTDTRELATGALATIDNQVDTATGTFKLRAVFANGNEGLFPNQFVNVRMLLDTERGMTVIPASGVERGELGAYVYVVQPDNTVAARPVTLGTQEGERIAIASGLEVGERVVTDGADKLREGMSVIVQAGSAPAGSLPAGAAGRLHRWSHGGGSADSTGPARPQ